MAVNHRAEGVIMKKCLALMIFLIIPGVVCVPQNSANSRQREEVKANYVDNQILVKFKPEVGALDSYEVSDFVAQRHGARAQPLHEARRGGQYLIGLDGSLSVE